MVILSQSLAYKCATRVRLQMFLEIECRIGPDDLRAAAPRAARRRTVVGEVGLEPTKASASGFTVRPLCRSGHSPATTFAGTTGVGAIWFGGAN